MSSPLFISAEKISQICLNPTFERYLKIVKRIDQAQASRVVEPPLAASGTLCFVSTPEQLQAATTGKASIIIALDKLKTAENTVGDSVALYSTPNISAAMALVLPLFDRKESRFAPGIHPSAFVDPTAKLGSDVRIGPFAVIGPEAEIGDQTMIGAHAVVERNAIVGARSILHPNSFVGAFCRIGKFCELHPGTVIGSDGFGYVQGHDQRRHKVPQLGIVVVEDFVEFGANCAIDRATLGETRIGEGTKFDNLCHVAHNCKIGKHNVFAGGFFIAGSSEIGDNCMFGGNAVIADHVKIGSQIVIGGLAGVTKDVLQPGAYSGYPLEPLKDAMRTIANTTHITKMRKQIAQIRKHLGLKDEET